MVKNYQINLQLFFFRSSAIQISTAKNKPRHNTRHALEYVHHASNDSVSTPRPLVHVCPYMDLRRPLFLYGGSIPVFRAAHNCRVRLSDDIPYERAMSACDSTPISNCA